MNHEAPQRNGSPEAQRFAGLRVDLGELPESQELQDNPEQAAARETLRGVPQLRQMAEAHAQWAIEDARRLKADEDKVNPQLERIDAEIEGLEAGLKHHKDKIAKSKHNNSWATNWHRKGRNKLDIKLSTLKDRKEEVEKERTAHKKQMEGDPVRSTGGYLTMTEKMANIDKHLQLRNEFRGQIAEMESRIDAGELAENDARYIDLMEKADRFGVFGDESDESLRARLTKEATDAYTEWLNGEREEGFKGVEEELLQRVEDMDRIEHPENYKDMKVEDRLKLVEQSKSWEPMPQFAAKTVQDKLKGKANVTEFHTWLEAYANQQRHLSEEEIEKKRTAAQEEATKEAPAPEMSAADKEREGLKNDLRVQQDKAVKIARLLEEAVAKRDKRANDVEEANKNNADSLTKNSVNNRLKVAESELRTANGLNETISDRIRAINERLGELGEPAVAALPPLPEKIQKEIVADTEQANKLLNQRMKVVRLWRESQENS